MSLKYLNIEDFECVGLVAKHCNLEKLCIAENEAMEFDLSELLCGYFVEVKNDWDNKGDLIEGVFYEDCRGNTVESKGLRTLLAYYTYSRYILINNYNDTAGGGVTKRNDWSFPKSYEEYKDYSLKYRNMAKSIWLGIEGWMCRNGYELKGCKGCGCGSNCGSGVNTKGYGFKPKNIIK